MLSIIKEISLHTTQLSTLVEAMTEARKEANNAHDHKQMAELYCDKVKPYFDQIRYHADKLELIVDNEDWPLVKYRELLFLR